ncbi:hypothetical protein H8K32_14035 [Undibacterium jejuense]|uniref:Peptidase M60 domain-containing protein n=1 Tax=Undibacterium jejuense TaxID=1344949 RepID=A0A923HK54_9BURK|nr:ImpA family metalloprotease [Undibacterium jejuense]MBC3863222.1 hypothetical protein [Undibacterium jejuense]
MRLKQWFKVKKVFVVAPLVTLLFACGGGGGGGQSTTTNAGTSQNGTTSDTSGGAPTDLIALALKSGDPSHLSIADAPTLLQQATALAIKYQQQQSTAISSIYAGNGVTPVLNLTTNSSDINIRNHTMAAPLVTADDGSTLAAVAMYGQGRALAYGADVLKWIATQSKEIQHTPVFNQAFTWAVTGNASGKLPTTVKFATAGYDAPTVGTLIASLGATPQAVTCDLVDPTNSCWINLDVLVFGAGTRIDSALSAQIYKYLAAGKAVVYMHASWIDSAGGRQVLNGMGMDLGGYPGNYFASASAVSVASGTSVSSMLQRNDQLTPLVTTLGYLGQAQPSLKLSTDASPATAITFFHNDLGTMQSNGIDLFNSPATDLYRLLVLWADLYRPMIKYGSINRDTAAGDFLRTYASDSWVTFNRATTTTATAGQGDYMPAAAQAIPVSSTDETITVTIPQASGITLIGRGAIPAKPISIQVVDSGSVTGLSVQTNHLRTWGDPLTDDVATKYKRPRRPNSFAIPLSTSSTASPMVFNSPFGGPLMLNYSGATPGQTITLKIRGAAKYSHFDMTQPQSAQDYADAIAATKRKDFGWQTLKLVGGEIQQIIGYVNVNVDPNTFIQTQIKDMLFNSNHIANGYNDVGMTTNVSTLCTQFGWTCDGNIHRAPNMQHMVGWIATCGYLCSGNPTDGYAGIDAGWGWAHEMGHNTVQRVLHIAFNGQGCVVECDNNILASAQMIRQYKLLGVDTGHTTDHATLYKDIVANRATGLTGNAKVLDMQTHLWTMANQDPMRAVHFQLAFLFSRYRANEIVPTMETTLDFLSLLNKSDRLVAKAWDPNNKGKYGMSRFADNSSISNPDLIFVLSSKIIGQDLRNIFAMYGITLSQAALDSVADLNLPVLPEQFYALAQSKFNQVSTGQWLDLSKSTPVYPF